MKIEIRSDFACPFCYLGKTELEQAIAHLNLKTKLKIAYKSFELNPNAGRDFNEYANDALVKKYNIPLDQVKSNNKELTRRAKQLGLDYQLDTLKIANTHDAHRLMHLARSYNLENEMVERLFKANFSENRNLADFGTLADLANEVGINRDSAMDMLLSQNYEDQIKNDVKEGSDYNLSGVPFFVIDQTYTMAGAQSQEAFIEFLEKALKNSPHLER